jgi:superfamily II DNA or RNA helicase
MTAFISKNGLILEVDVEVKKELIRLYTIILPISQVAMVNARMSGYAAKPEQFAAYFVDRQYLILPRNAIFNPLVNKHIQKVNFSPVNNSDNYLPDSRKFEIELVGNQPLIINYVIDNYLNENKINSGMATAVLQLGTGMGKTYIAAGIIHRIGQRTLWVLPNTSIMEQTLQVLEVAFPDLIVGQWFATKHDNPKNCHIMLAIVDSLISINKSDLAVAVDYVYKPRKKKVSTTYTAAEWMNFFGLTVFDEIHLYLGATISNVFWTNSAPIVFGMSATTNENKNNLDVIYKMHYGQEIISDKIPNFEKDDCKWKCSVEVIKYQGSKEFTKIHVNEYNGIPNFLENLSQVTIDPKRNELIIDCIETALRANHSIFVFTEYREHAKELARLYCLKNNINLAVSNDDEINLDIIQGQTVLMGGASKDDVNTARNNSNVIFTTHSYCSTGVSIPKMTAIVLATPRKSNTTQLLGRIFRRGYKPEMERIVYDIVDESIHIFKNQFRVRKLVYKEKGYDIKINGELKKEKKEEIYREIEGEIKIGEINIGDTVSFL